MKKINLNDILCGSALTSLELQNDDGSFPNGHNGPWNDVDTPVRTTAHWALTLFKAYDITGGNIFLEAALKACDYLIKKEQRPYGYTFYCRTNQTGKNRCNGLIGQVWAIEPLVFVGHRINNPEYLNVAHKIALLHEYDYKCHLWKNTEITGEILGINYALNQQVWFAALLMIIGKTVNDESLRKAARDFFVHFPSSVSFIEEGLIRHKMENKLTRYQRMKNNINFSGGRKKTMDTGQMTLLSQGYSSFLLYGLALAYAYGGEEDFWGDVRIKAIISGAADYIVKKFPFGHGESTGYRWCYNPTGIEMSYVLQVFQKYLKIEPVDHAVSAWLNKQFEFYYDFTKKMMCKNTGDPVILSSRIYEATRLNNYSLSLSEHE